MQSGATAKGKPGGGGDPPPPPLGPEVYEWREDLGGWLDTSRNLVWGYDQLGIGGYGITYAQAQQRAQNYAAYLQELADASQSVHLQAAADVAALYDNWRVPTREECTDATAKGLFTYGDGGFNGYSSFPGEPPGLAYGDTNRWTNDLGKPNEKLYGQATAWAWHPMGGGTGLATLNSLIGVIWVRTHVP
jgi:hypothetical protein